jgi:hypothetical protein
MLLRLCFRTLAGRLVCPAAVGFCCLILLGVGSCGGDNNNKPQCDLDADCAGTPATPYCSAELTCVACEETSQCAGTTPVCEPTTHTCQACSADSQCASGVCLETSGSCAAPAQLIYVKELGGADAGMCDEKAPCATITYATGRVTAQRDVIRVIGNLTKSAGLQTKVTIDGDGSTWKLAKGVAASAVLVNTAAADVIIEGLTLAADNNASPVVDCSNGALRLHQTTISGGDQAGISAACKLTVTRSKISLNFNNGVICSGGSLTIEDSEVGGNTGRAIISTNCGVRLARNRIEGNSGVVFAIDLASPAKLEVENNLIWAKTVGNTRGISVSNAPTGGLIRFNTIVNIAAGAHVGEGVHCDGTSTVTSNVIAWQAGAAVAANDCARRFNAYDSSTPIGGGDGNVSAALTSLFVNPVIASPDFHLAAGSPAHALAEPGVSVPVDLDGKARPTTGRLDAGSFETP